MAKRNNVLRTSLERLDLPEPAIQAILDRPSSAAQQSGEPGLVAAVTDAYGLAFRIVFRLGAGLAAAAFVVAWGLMPHVDLTRPDDAALKEAGRRADEERRMKASSTTRGHAG